MPLEGQPRRRSRARNNHRTRAHLPHHQHSRRLTRRDSRNAAVEDQIGATEHHSQPQSVVQVFPQTVIYLPQIPRSPAASQPLPWAHLWPELADYYYNNSPDYSGHGLYTIASRHNKEYAVLALQEPASFTAQILHAESARVENRMADHRLLWLKSVALSLINEALRDSDRSTAIGTLSAVAAMAASCIINQESMATRAHLKGLKQMLQVRGGLSSMNPVGVARTLVAYVDSVHTYFEGVDRHIADWDVPSRPPESAVFFADPVQISKVNSGLFPRLTDVASHPIRIAMQPLYSSLSATRLRNHLLMSLGSPLTALLTYLGVINVLAEMTLLPPYWKSPQEARRAASAIEYYLLAYNSRVRFFLLTHPMYSAMDKHNHEVVQDCVIHVALIFVTALLSTIDDTTVARKRLDHNIQTLYAVDLKSITWRHPKLVLWAQFLATSLDSEGDHARLSAVKTMCQICRGLNINSAVVLREILEEIFYCRTLQDDVTTKLWNEMEPLIMVSSPKTEEPEDVPSVSCSDASAGLFVGSPSHDSSQLHG